MLGHGDRTEAAFADELEDLVATDPRTGALARPRGFAGGVRINHGDIQKAARLNVRSEQRLHRRAQRRIVAARLIEKRRPLGHRTLLQCLAGELLELLVL